MPAPARPVERARIRALSLDLDDTLWAIGPVIERAERRLYGWLHERYPRVTAAADPAALRRLRVEVMDEHPDRHHDFTFLRREMLLRLARSAGYPDEMSAEAFAAFSRWRNEVEPFDDVLPALTTLAARFRLVAVTNGNADLGQIGLARFFTDVVTARETGVAKPDRRIFDAVLDRLGVTPQELLHIGDAPRDDIEGAHGAGIASVWVNRHDRSWSHPHVAPAAIVRDLGELIAWLDARDR